MHTRQVAKKCIHYSYTCIVNKLLVFLLSHASGPLRIDFFCFFVFFFHLFKNTIQAYDVEDIAQRFSFTEA